MMTEYDRTQVEYNPSRSITFALTLLRRIRGYSESLYIGDPDYTIAQRRQFLLDAEMIGQTSANFLLDSPNGSLTEARNTWLTTMAELSPKYVSFPEVTARFCPVEYAAERVESNLDLLRFLASMFAGPDTQQVFQEQFLDKNHTGLSFPDLLDNRLAMFSPLSTDYLTACLLRRFIRITFTADSFRLKPIILDRYLRPVGMPDEDQDWLAGINRVGVFVENNTSFDTLKATWKAVQKFSPLV